MRMEDFTPEAWGRIACGVEGYAAFVPHGLPPSISFTMELISALSVADRALGQLAGITRTLPNPRLLIRTFISREAVLSSRIEGTQASLSDLFLFNVAPAAEQTTPDVREVFNYVRAMDHGMMRLRQIPLTLNLILEMHGILLSGVRGADRKPGQFRRVANWIGPHGCSREQATYVPPPASELPGLLDALEKFIHAPTHLPTLLRLAMVHYQFEAIHPFEDGNGRLGRLLISLMLAMERALPHPVLYLSAYLEAHRAAYYDHLLAVSQRGEWNRWMIFFLRGVTEQAIDAVERAARLTELRGRFTAKCHRVRSSALLLRLIDELFINPFISAAAIGAALSISHQSTIRNIEQLVGLSILTEITKQKRNRIWTAPEIVRALEQPPTLDPVP